MAAWMPAEFLLDGVKTLGAAGLFVLMLWSLAECLLGYVIFRLVLAVTGLLAGAFIGVALVSWRVPSPSGLDYFLGSVVASGLLALGGWYLYRLAFAIGLGAGAALLVAASGSPSSVGWWILGGLVGLTLGVAGYLYLRALFIFLSGLGGGFGAVFYAGSIIAGGAEHFVEAAMGPDAPLWLTAVVLAVSAGVSVAGMYSQRGLLRIVHTSLTPEERPKKRRAGRGPGLAERAGGRR
jgi:hypothetical protein